MLNVNQKKILYQLVANENIVKTMQRISMSAQGLNNDLNRVGRNLQNNFNNVNSMLTKTTNNFEKMRRTMLRLSSVAVLPLAFIGSREYLRTEKSIAMYNTIQDYNMSEDQKRKLRENAYKVGLTSYRSTSEIIGLSTELEKGGFDSGIMRNELKGSMVDLASKIMAITDMTVDRVGDTLITLSSSYGLKNLPVKEMESKVKEIYSKYITGANLSKFNYSDIDKLSRKSVPTLLGSGFDIDTIIAMQSVLANTFQTSVVDRGLSSIMQRLSNLPGQGQSFLRNYAGIDVKKLKKSGVPISDIFFKILDYTKNINDLKMENFDPKNEYFINLMKWSQKSASQFRKLNEKQLKDLKDNMLTSMISTSMGKEFSNLVKLLANNMKLLEENKTIISATKSDKIEETFTKTLPPLETSFKNMGLSFSNMFYKIMKNGLEEKIIKVIDSLSNFMDKIASDDKLLKNIGETVFVLGELIIGFAALNVVLKTTAGIMATAGFISKAGKGIGKIAKKMSKSPAKLAMGTGGWGLLIGGLLTAGGMAWDHYNLTDYFKNLISGFTTKSNEDKQEDKKINLKIDILSSNKYEYEENDYFNTDISYQGVQLGFK